jgi:hypothetical protein
MTSQLKVWPALQEPGGWHVTSVTPPILNSPLPDPLTAWRT